MFVIQAPTLTDDLAVEKVCRFEVRDRSRLTEFCQRVKSEFDYRRCFVLVWQKIVALVVTFALLCDGFSLSRDNNMYPHTRNSLSLGTSISRFDRCSIVPSVTLISIRRMASSIFETSLVQWNLADKGRARLSKELECRG